MEKPSDVLRTTRLALSVGIGALMLSASLAAAQTKAPAARSFGDTAAYGVRILSISPDSETTTFTSRSNKNLIVLEVIPGKSIEVLLPGGPGPKKLKTPQTYTFSMQRFEVAHTPENDAAQRAAEDAYERCVRNADAAARRAAAAKPKGVDATGKEVSRTQSEVATTMADASSGGHSCSRGMGNARVAPRMVRLAPRAPADRYLVVLSSTESVSYEELVGRLEVLSTVATDVGTTIEAMAAGIFFDKKGSWGGAFIPW